MRSRRSAYEPGASPGSADGKAGAAAGAVVPFCGWVAGGRLEYSPVRVVPQPASNEATASRPRPMMRVYRISAKRVFPGTDHGKYLLDRAHGPTGVRHSRGPDRGFPASQERIDASFEADRRRQCRLV